MLITHHRSILKTGVRPLFERAPAVLSSLQLCGTVIVMGIAYMVSHARIHHNASHLSAQALGLCLSTMVSHDLSRLYKLSRFFLFFQLAASSSFLGVTFAAFMRLGLPEIVNTVGKQNIAGRLALGPER